jgi:hypothetical protein
MDFDDLPVNEPCEGIGSGRSYVVAEESASEPNACRMWIEEGMTGWGTWGGTITLPERLHEGDEIWIRLRVFMPEDFIPIAPGAGERLKFLRLHTRTGDGAHAGYNDILFNREGAINRYAFGYEGFNRWYMFGEGLGLPELGRWVTYEWYLRLDSSFEDGSPRVRFWEDGELLADFTERRTLSEPDGYARAVYIGTYWNGGAPQTQHMYIDDLVITNERPPNRDTYGNPFVGVDGMKAPPNPPTWQSK